MIDLEKQEQPEPATNAAAVDALWAQMMPPELIDAEAPEAMEPPALRRVIELAKNPKLGVPFEVRGVAYRFRFLSIDAEEALGQLAARNPFPALQAAAVILADQAPDFDPASLEGVPNEALYDLVAAQRALDKDGADMASVLGDRRDRWRKRERDYGSLPVSIPTETQASAMLEWASRTYGHHPADVRRLYSSALLAVLFDAWWWQTCAQPPDPGPSPPNP